MQNEVVLRKRGAESGLVMEGQKEAKAYKRCASPQCENIVKSNAWIDCPCPKHLENGAKRIPLEYCDRCEEILQPLAKQVHDRSVCDYWDGCGIADCGGSICCRCEENAKKKNRSYECAYILTEETTGINYRCGAFVCKDEICSDMAGHGFVRCAASGCGSFCSNHKKLVFQQSSHCEERCTQHHTDKCPRCQTNTLCSSCRCEFWDYSSPSDPSSFRKFCCFICRPTFDLVCTENHFVERSETAFSVPCSSCSRFICEIKCPRNPNGLRLVCSSCQTQLFEFLASRIIFGIEDVIPIVFSYMDSK